jgi:hypothetical protein
MLAYSNELQDPFTTSKSLFDEFVLKLNDTSGDFGSLERFIELEGKEVLRCLLQEKLDAVEEPVTTRMTGADGIVRAHRRATKIKKLSVFGEVEIFRTQFSTKEGKSVNSLFPKDKILNLPDRKTSYRIQELVSKSAAKNSFESAKEDLESYKDIHLSKRTIEQITVAASRDFEEFYEQRSLDALQETAKHTDYTVLTTDAKGIVVRKEDLRAHTKKAAEKENKESKGKRLGQGEKKNRKRMAQVAAVYHVDKHERTASDVIYGKADNSEESRPKVQAKRVWANLSEDATHTINQAMSEVERRDPDKNTTLVGLVDGNEHQINCLEESAHASGRAICIIVDIIHVLEYLWTASRAFFSASDPQCQQFVTHYLTMLLTKGKRGASLAAAGMRSKATTSGLSQQERKAVDKACNYLLKLKKYLNYQDYIKQGMPIGTGVIEGACRHLICDRLDITGARWSLTGAEAVLRLRSLWASGDWDTYWTYYIGREKDRLYGSFYEENTACVKPKLTLVK